MILLPETVSDTWGYPLTRSFRSQHFRPALEQVVILCHVPKFELRFEANAPPKIGRSIYFPANNDLANPADVSDIGERIGIQ